MSLIRPSADLRNNYNEISRICHATKEPIFITKNGYNDLVVLSDEAYEIILNEKEKTEEERIERLIEKHFDKHYDTFEEFKKDILVKIEKALKDVDEGKTQSMEEFCKEMEEKYDLH